MNILNLIQLFFFSINILQNTNEFQNYEKIFNEKYIHTHIYKLSYNKKIFFPDFGKLKTAKNIFLYVSNYEKCF